MVGEIYCSLVRATSQGHKRQRHKGTENGKTLFGSWRRNETFDPPIGNVLWAAPTLHGGRHRCTLGPAPR